MYKCLDCGEIFEEPVHKVYRRQRFVEPYEPEEASDLCPFCGSEEFEAVQSCPCCNDGYVPVATLSKVFADELDETICEDCRQLYSNLFYEFLKTLPVPAKEWLIENIDVLIEEV